VALEASTFRQAVTENTLRSCQLFMGLPATDIATIASFIVPKHLDKGDYLFREGDRSEGFMSCRKGRSMFIA
jgi:CRP-like cAMP-binding protein